MRQNQDSNRQMSSVRENSKQSKPKRLAVSCQWRGGLAKNNFPRPCQAGGREKAKKRKRGGGKKIRSTNARCQHSKRGNGHANLPAQAYCCPFLPVTLANRSPFNCRSTDLGTNDLAKVAHIVLSHVICKRGAVDGD